jgi:hypothetical protein
MDPFWTLGVHHPALTQVPGAAFAGVVADGGSDHPLRQLRGGFGHQPRVVRAADAESVGDSRAMQW